MKKESFLWKPNSEKNGHRRGPQMYKCYGFGRQFQEKTRIKGETQNEEYLQGKRTYKEMAAIHGCSVSTIRRHLHSEVTHLIPYVPKESVVIMSTTYFGRSFGMMIFQDAETGRILNSEYVKNESNRLYKDGLDEIGQNGTSIEGQSVMDTRGCLNLFGDIPVQMCQFYQIQIERRLLTQNPHLIAGRELLMLCKSKTGDTQDELRTEFDCWCKKWKSFLDERTVLPTGRSFYTHRRLRAVYYHLLWSFTYLRGTKFKIPNTTHRLKGTNSELKRRLRCHNGLSGTNKTNFIDGF